MSDFFNWNQSGRFIQLRQEDRPPKQNVKTLSALYLNIKIDLILKIK